MNDCALQHRARHSLCAAVLAVFLAACSTPGESGHTFEVIDEGGVPVAVSSAVPKFDGELFTYERVLTIRPDSDNPETLLYQPSSITRGDDGLYYVADTGNHRIVVFDAQGRFVRTFGREGEGPGELLSPALVEVRDGIVSVFGEDTRRFRCDGTFVDVLDSGRVARYADDGTLVVESTARQTADDGTRAIAAVARMFDNDGEVVAEVESGYTPSATWMQYKGAPSVLLLPGNEILATAGVEPTIDVYGIDGAPKRRVRIDLPTQPVSDADRAAVDELWARFIENRESTSNSPNTDHFLEMKERTSYPPNRAFWGRPIVEDGRWLWLPGSLPRLAVWDPHSEPIAQQAWFRIVDPRGEFIGTTLWPPEALMLSGASIIGGHLLALVWDDEIEEMVPTVYRVRPRVEGLVYP